MQAGKISSIQDDTNQGRCPPALVMVLDDPDRASGWRPTKTYAPSTPTLWARSIASLRDDTPNLR